MTPSAHSSEDAPVAAPRRQRWKRLRQRLVTATPVVVWGLAIIAALQLQWRLSAGDTLTGFADHQPVTIAHSEPGVVQDVHVRLYDEVVAGQVLLTLDDRQERIELAAVEKDIERLGAEVAAAQVRLRADNAQTQANADDLCRQFVLDRETAHIAYLSQLVVNAYDRIMLRGRTVEMEILRRLYGQGGAAFQEFNQIEIDVEALRAKTARNAEVIAQLKHVFDEADRRWARFAARQDITVALDPVLTPLRLNVEIRERDLQQIVRRIDSHVLRAPLGGQVTTLAAHAGDHVDASAPLVTISPATTDRVVAYLPEDLVKLAQVGMPVTVRCLAEAGVDGRQYSGMIAGLSAAVLEAPVRYRRVPTLPVWGRGLVVALDDGANLIPGEAVTVALSARH